MDRSRNALLETTVELREREGLYLVVSSAHKLTSMWLDARSYSSLQRSAQVIALGAGLLTSPKRRPPSQLPSANIAKVWAMRRNVGNAVKMPC